MEPEAVAIRTRPVPACPLCGTAGRTRYEGLRDRLFGAPGTWGIRECGSGACGTLWLDPVPIPEDLGKAYLSYFTHEERPPARPRGLRRLALAAREGWLAGRYGGPPAGAGKRILGLLAWLHPGWRAEMGHRAMHLRARPGGRLLEVGCGSGELLAGVRDLGWSVTGVDFDAAAVAVARRRGLTVHEGDLAAQGFAPGSFDAVTMFHLFEHVPDVRVLLAECFRLLAPGGRLVVVTPNPEGRGHRRFGISWMGLDPPRHLHLLPPRTLGSEAERAGFRVAELRTTLRDAELVLEGSASIARTGRYRFGDPIPRSRRPATLAFLYGSWLAGLWRAHAGEETLLVAIRP
jgi:SAM-dependent methyltransferase